MWRDWIERCDWAREEAEAEMASSLFGDGEEIEVTREWPEQGGVIPLSPALQYRCKKAVLRLE
jgi:hypothetical protein